jgi:hypothetical protein
MRKWWKDFTADLHGFTLIRKQAHSTKLRAGEKGIMFCDFCRRKARTTKNRKTVFRGIENNEEVRSAYGGRPW